MTHVVPTFATQPDPEAEGESALHAAPGFFSWVSALVHVHRERLLAYARTGASSGIGLAIAKALLERGYGVVATSRNASRCGTTQDG